MAAPTLKVQTSVKGRTGRVSVTGDAPRASYTGQDGEEKVVYINPSSLASGGIAEKAAAIFRVYDPNNKNQLDHDSMMQALAELGVINGLTSKKLTEILSIGSDGAVGKGRSYSLQEFVSFYERLAHYQAKAARQERIKALSKMPGIPDGAEGNEMLKRVFLNYCKYTVGQGRSTYDEQEPKMSSTQYVKLCQDLGLVQPNGPLNVVTVDVIFHKVKPQGGRRLLYVNYLKALSAAAEEANMNVFELIGLLGTQINTNTKAFFAPQPVIFRQETRSMEQSKFKVASEEAVVAEEPSDDEDVPLPMRKPRPPREKILEMSDDEDEPTPKAKKDKPVKEPKSPEQPKTPTSPTRPAFQEEVPVNNEPAPSLYSMGMGGKSWLASLPPDAPEWVHDMANKMGELEQQVVSTNKENYELRQQVKNQLAKSRLGNGSGVDYAAFEALAQAAGIDPASALAAAQQGGVSGADMANLLVDVDKRLKAMEGGPGGRRGIKGVKRGDGEDGEEEDEDELMQRVDTLEKQMEEVRDGEKLKADLKDDMKKLAKAAAGAATKGLPSLEQRVGACEAKDEELEKGAANQAAKVASLEGKVKSLSDGLNAEVTRAINNEMGKNLGVEMTKLLAPGGDLGKVVAANVEQMAGEMNDRITSIEAFNNTNNAKVGALESVVAEQAAKVEQSFAMAQEGMSRQVAAAPKLAALEASAADWARLSSSLESAVRELQVQVKELYSKNTTLEAEIETLKNKGGAGAGGDGQYGLEAETMVKGEAPGGMGHSSSMSRRGPGANEMIQLAELTGMVKGLEGALKDTQQGLTTALTAVGFTPLEASKDNGPVTAASRRAAQEATLSELNTRMGSVEHRQQEATVLLKKAEAMLSGPAAGLAAMNAANAAAANAAANQRKERKGVDEEVVMDLASRISTVENRLKEQAAAVSAATVASSAVPALESAVNNKIPNLENQIRQQEMNTKGLQQKIGDVESFMTTVRTKLPELDTALKVAETRVTELERKAGNNDRNTRELSDLIKALQIEQEGMAANAAMSAQLRGQNAGSGGSGGVDPAALQLVMATEERLQRHITKLNDAINNQIAELDAAKVKYDTNLDMVQSTFEALHMRLNNMDGNGGGGNDSRISTYARMTELRDMENHFMDRVRLQGETCDKMQRAINQLVSDVERIANQHNNSEQQRMANNLGTKQSGIGSEQVALLEQRVEARLAMLATQYITVEALREWEMRFVTNDGLRAASDKARANDEVILKAVKEVDKQLHEKLEVSQQVMLRMARQVDVLQNTLRSAPPPDAGASQIKIIKGGGGPAPPMPNVSATMAAFPRPESGQDPLSILLAQAGAANPAPDPTLQ